MIGEQVALVPRRLYHPTNHPTNHPTIQLWRAVDSDVMGSLDLSPELARGTHPIATRAVTNLTHLYSNISKIFLKADFASNYSIFVRLISG